MTIVSLGAACSAQSQGHELQPTGAVNASAGESGSEGAQSAEPAPGSENGQSAASAGAITRRLTGCQL